MRLPSKGLKNDFEEAKKQQILSIENGINYIDTAWPYHNGESEIFLGMVLGENYWKNDEKAELTNLISIYY